MISSTLKGDSCATDRYILNNTLKRIRQKQIHLSSEYHEEARGWSNEEKSNLIVSILNGYAFPSIAVAVLGRFSEIVIDGTQRLKACLEYKNNELKISDNVARSIIKYQKMKKEEDGQIIGEVHEFDLRGKFYSDLPEELKDDFDDYNLIVDRYWCQEEDILYHVRRYNSTNIR